MIKPISTWTRTFSKLGYILRRVWPDDRDYSDNYAPLALEVLEERQMLSGFGGPGDDPFGGSGSGNGDSQGDYSNGTGGGSPSSPFSGGSSGGDNRIQGLSGNSPTTLFSYSVSSDRIVLPEYWNALPEGYSYSSTSPWMFRPTHSTAPSTSSEGYRFSEQTELDGFPGTYIVTLSHLVIESFVVTATGFQDLGNYEYTEHVKAKLTQIIIETNTPDTTRETFQAGADTTFASYIRFTAFLDYEFKINLLNGETTSFEQQVVSEDTETEFNWTTTNIQSPFSGASYPSNLYYLNATGEASNKGVVKGTTSLKITAQRSGTDISYTVTGNGRSWVPEESKLVSTINFSAVAITGDVIDLGPNGESDPDVSVFRGRTIDPNKVGKFKKYTVNGNITTTFDRSFNISSDNLRRTSASPITLVGSITKIYTDETKTTNDLTTTWLTTESWINLIKIDDNDTDDGASDEGSADDLTTSTGTPTGNDSDIPPGYRLAVGDDLRPGEKTWLLQRNWSKITNKDTVTTKTNNRHRTEYEADGTRRDSLDHDSPPTTNVASAPPVLHSEFTKDFKVENVSHEVYTARRVVPNLVEQFSNETTEQTIVASDHQTGPTTTEIQASVSIRANQTGHQTLQRPEYTGTIINKVNDKSIHQISEKEVWQTEKKGRLVRQIGSDGGVGVEVQSVAGHEPLEVESTARFSQTDQNTRTEIHDDHIHLEYRFVDANTFLIVDKSQYQTITRDYSGALITDNYLRQSSQEANGSPNRFFDLTFSDKSHEVKTGEVLDGSTTGDQTILRITNDTEVTLRRIPSSAGHDEFSASATPPVANISNGMSMQVDLSDFEYKKKTGTETVSMASKVKSTYDKEENKGYSRLHTKMGMFKAIGQFDYEDTNSQQEWSRSGYTTNKLSFTKTTTFDYTPAGAEPLEDLERFKVVYDGHSIQAGRIEDSSIKTFRQVVSSEGFSQGVTLADFRSRWHSSNRDTVDGNKYYSDWTDNRTETNVMTTNIQSHLDLTYVVTELPQPTASTDSGTGNNNQNGNQGQSQYNGSSNSTPPGTQTGNEPSFDENRYRSVVTGTKTELIRTDLETTVGSSYQQRLNGSQEVSIEPSTTWGRVTNIGWEIAEADRTRIHRSATTDWKRSIVAKPGKTTVATRKHTLMEFAPDSVKVTVKSLLDDGTGGEGNIVTKHINESLDGYVFESKHVFIGNLNLRFTPGSNGGETFAEETGTHGFHSRSFTEWKSFGDADFLHLTANSSLYVGAAGLTYLRMVSPGEFQSAVFQYTNAQASALPEFDSQWVQSGFLRSIDNYRVKQTNQGTTETIIRWKMQYERFDSRNYSAFSEREIY